MCQLAYFRNACSKADFIEVMNFVNAQGVESSCWGFFTAVCKSMVSYFVPVGVDYEISGGRYLYVVFDDEDAAVVCASKSRSGSLVIPDAESSDWWFVMRVD